MRQAAGAAIDDIGLQLQLQRERAAAAEIAARIDAAAEQFGQMLADGETETSAFEAPRRRIVDLLKRLKELLQRILRNADAGVVHLETNVDFALLGGGVRGGAIDAQF